MLLNQNKSLSWHNTRSRLYIHRGWKSHPELEVCFKICSVLFFVFLPSQHIHAGPIWETHLVPVQFPPQHMLASPGWGPLNTGKERNHWHQTPNCRTLSKQSSVSEGRKHTWLKYHHPSCMLMVTSSLYVHVRVGVVLQVSGKPSKPEVWILLRYWSYLKARAGPRQASLQTKGLFFSGPHRLEQVCLYNIRLLLLWFMLNALIPVKQLLQSSMLVCNSDVEFVTH